MARKTAPATRNWPRYLARNMLDAIYQDNDATNLPIPRATMRKVQAALEADQAAHVADPANGPLDWASVDPGEFAAGDQDAPEVVAMRAQLPRTHTALEDAFEELLNWAD